MVDLLSFRRQIYDFVEENPGLKKLTGESNVFFRGGVFGTSSAREIQKSLKDGKRVEILWLGSNPNGDRIKNFTEFERELNSDRISPAVDRWDPVRGTEVTQWFWRSFRDEFVVPLLSEGERDWQNAPILTANFVPWESSQFNLLFTQLKDPELSARIIEFCDSIFRQMIETFNPKYIIAPRSVLSVSKYAKDSKILFKQKPLTHDIKLSRRKAYIRYYPADEAKKLPAMFFVPHPSYLPRLIDDDRERLFKGWQTFIRPYIHL